MWPLFTATIAVSSWWPNGDDANDDDDDDLTLNWTEQTARRVLQIAKIAIIRWRLAVSNLVAA